MTTVQRIFGTDRRTIDDALDQVLIDDCALNSDDNPILHVNVLYKASLELDTLSDYIEGKSHDDMPVHYGR